jgi:hypothetical protein
MIKSIINIPLTQDEIKSLTSLFENTFSFYCTHPEKIDSIEAQNYIITLNTVVGLSLTIILAQQDLISEMKELINQFMYYHPFYQYPNQTILLASAITSLVCCSTDLLQDLRYPPYYKDFIEALEECIRHMDTKTK